MKAFRFVFFTILIPILCALFFAFSSFAAGKVVGLVPNNSQGIAGTNVNNISSLGIPYVASGSVRVTFCNNSGYSSDRIYVFLIPYGNTKGQICAVSDKSTSLSVYNGTSNFNLLWNNPVSTSVNVDGQTFYWSNNVWGSIPNSASYDHLKMFNNVQEAIAYFFAPDEPPKPLTRLEDDSLKWHVNTLKDFKYSLLDTQPWDDLISRWLQAHNLVSVDFMQYTSGIYHFTWGNTIDMHIPGQNIISDVPLSGVQVQYGYLNLYTGDIVKQLTWKTYEDGFFNSYQPDFAGIQSYIYTLLDNFANFHPVILFTPVVEYEGSRYFGETLVFDMALKKIGSDSPWFNNDTSVTGSDGNTYNVDFGSGSSSSYTYQGGEWDSTTDIDLGDSLTNYNNYITNNNGLSVDEILYILTHDPRFQSGPTEIVITPQFDPNGISDNDDLWLGKLRDLYQMILGFNPLIARIVSAFSSYFIFLPDWVFSFIFTVGSVGLLLGVVKVIRG